MRVRGATGFMLGMLMVGTMLARPVAGQDHAAPADVSGVWEFSLMDFAWSLEFSVQGHEISGELVITDFGDFALDAVQMNGDELVVAVEAGGNSLEFVGTVEGDKYTGGLSGFHGQPPMPFVAIRQGS